MNNERNIGRRYGSAPPSSKASAIKDAATIADVTELTPLEYRAFRILKGARRVEKTKHPIEKRALRLAKAVEAEWFIAPSISGRPRGAWNPRPKDESFEVLKQPVTQLQVVKIAAPIIEDFGRSKITLRSPAFEALYRTVCIYSGVIVRDAPVRDSRVTVKSVYRALNQARHEMANLSNEVESGL